MGTETNYNLRTAPSRIAELNDALLPARQRMAQLSAEEAQDDARYQAFLATDPDLARGPGRCWLFEEIQNWVRERGRLTEELHQRRCERAHRADEISRDSAPLTAELNRLNRLLTERRRRLTRLREQHACDLRLGLGLADPSVFSEFVGRCSGEIHAFLKSRKVAPTHCDQLKMPPLPEDRPRGLSAPNRRPQPAVDGELSSVRTLAAIYAQLGREVGLPVRKSFEEGFTQALRRAGIKNVLEVGPGRRGLVNLLAESGLAAAAKLRLHSIDISPDPGIAETMDRAGIRHITGDASRASSTLGPNSMDLIVAVGVLSSGGQLGLMNEISLKKYVLCADKSHELLNALRGLLSPQPHALLAASSIFGVLSLFRDRLTGFHAAYWRKASSQARQEEQDRHLRLSPIDPVDLRRHSHSAAAGREFCSWYGENSAQLDLLEAMIEQSADLAVLKRD